MAHYQKFGLICHVYRTLLCIADVSGPRVLQVVPTFRFFVAL